METKTPLIPAISGGIVRAILAALGGFGVSAGGDTEKILGALSILATAVWTIIAKIRAKKHSDTQTVSAAITGKVPVTVDVPAVIPPPPPETKSPLPQTPSVAAAIKKIVPPAMLVLSLTLLGCAKFSGYTDRTLADGTKEHVHFRSFTLFDSKSEIARGASLLTAKTAKVGVLESKQEANGSNTVRALEIIGENIPK